MSSYRLEGTWSIGGTTASLELELELETAGTVRLESLAQSVCKDQPREIKAQRGESLA